MSQQGQTFSLARQNAWLLAAFFIVFELLAAGAMLIFLMAPMAQRAADDLAGLMVLSAQTWSELPPETRMDFEIELIRTHTLSLRESVPGEANRSWQGGIYVHYLEQALAKKTGQAQPLSRSSKDGEDWIWASLPSGNQTLAVGFPVRRVGTHPIQALMLTLVAGLVLAVLAAIWLARRITRPLARMEQAVTQVGLGETPERLPESGPRELSALARRFNQMTQQVQDLLMARTTLLAGISHDLRTPLARIRLALALLETQPTPARIARIEHDVEEMDRLIGDILSLSRDLTLEPSGPVDLSTLLADLLQHVSPGRVKLSLPDRPVIVQARTLALKRVIGNLLNNALRYGAEQAVEVCIVQREQAVGVGIRDQGPGIPEAQLEAVFMPFHRVDSSRSPETGGFGLGLAIVRQLSSANGWRVELVNRKEGGLAAWLWIDTSSSLHQPGSE